MDDHLLQLHIPAFVYNVPTVVNGGGAELITPDWLVHSPCRAQNEFGFPPVEHDQHQSSSNPFDYPLPAPLPFPAPAPPPPPTPDLSIFLAQPSPFAAPSPLGLPVYSASGFDLLSILARVATRPFPRIVLGPVDLTCSFVVVDVRRYDHPVVYCSPSFCTLTGYDQDEVLGRNCRFLQAPGGNVERGEPRKFTSQDAVNHLRKSLMADKECQTSIVNYKKNGAAFINLVTVIPVPGGLTGAPDEHDIVYQVGFQVDLTEQPNAILEKLRDGSYLVNYASYSNITPFGHGSQRSATQSLIPLTGNARDRKANAIQPLVMSKDLKRMLADPTFIRSIPITNTSTTSTSVPTLASADDSGSGGLNHPLSMILLETSPDFIHVVSLKGSFLYVAPSVRRVLGYEAEEMVGTSLSDYAHPEDVIPLMRELKESSATGTSSAAVAAMSNENASSQVAPGVVPQLGVPRSVGLLFRALSKMGRYVWVECRGRLHVEPGKGRKAIILSGRAREMMSLKWDDVRRAGGLAKGLRAPVEDRKEGGVNPGYKDVEQEVWGMLGGVCKDTATFMSVGKGIEDVLGWTPDELLGRGLAHIVCDDATAVTLGRFISSMRAYQKQRYLPVPQRGGAPADTSRVMKLRCWLRRKDSSEAVDAWFVLYRADAEVEEPQALVETRGAGMSITPAALVYQIRLAEAETMMPSPSQTSSALVPMNGNVPQPKSTSSLAGAVILPPSTQTQTQTSTSTATGLPPSMDMFEELSTSRGSSWQYELQQLRITNLRLREELAALEAAEANGAMPSTETTRTTASSQSPIGYEQPPTPQQQQQQSQRRVYSDIAPQPLFTSQPQQSHHRHIEQHHLESYPQLPFDYEIPQPLPPPLAQQKLRQQSTYLHQPTPLQQYAQSQNQQRGPIAILPRPSRRGTPYEWTTMPSPLSGYGSGLKRSWNSIDAP